MRGLLLSLLFVASLSFVGCSSPTAQAKSSSSGGSGLGHELGRELFGSNKATRSGVAVDVYFDVSDSSTALRKSLTKLMEQVVDTDPDAVQLTYSFFGKNCNLQGNAVTSLTGLRRAGKDWVGSQMHDDTTNLSEVFKRIQENAKAEPETQFVAVIVTDGGYEDPDAARGAIKKLQDLPNLKLLAFVGVHTGDNPKLQRLVDLTRPLKQKEGDPAGLSVALVTDKNNDAPISDARDAINQVIASGKKVK